MLAAPDEFAEVLRARSTGCLCLQDIQGAELVTGRAALEIAEDRFETHVPVSGQSLTGTPVFPGKVEGRVFVIRSESEVPRMPSGAVLVVSMTRPEHIPAVVRASAIVTDEGGLTSHAVQVSWERRIPCVIGTQYATRRLSTGDNVIVDAAVGEVRVADSGPEGEAS